MSRATGAGGCRTPRPGLRASFTLNDVNALVGGRGRGSYWAEQSPDP